MLVDGKRLRALRIATEFGGVSKYGHYQSNVEANGYNGGAIAPPKAQFD